MSMLRYILCTLIIVAASLPSCSFLYGPAVDGQDDGESFISPDELPGLAYWFAAYKGVTIDTGNATPNSVSTWENLAGNGLNGTTVNQIYEPVRVDNVLNGKPVIRFDTTANPNCPFFSYDGTLYVGSSYTIFLAVVTSASYPDNIIIGGQTTSLHENLMIGFASSNLINNHWGADLIVSVIRDTNGELITCALDKNVAKYTYYNGTIAAYTTDSSGNNLIAPLISNAGACIGRVYWGMGAEAYFNGDIAEYIGYTRKLTDSEIQAVEAYLNNKYGLY